MDFFLVFFMNKMKTVELYGGPSEDEISPQGRYKLQVETACSCDSKCINCSWGLTNEALKLTRAFCEAMLVYEYV
jgi:hypothetical protein